MIPTLQTNKKFLEDYRNYQEKISKIEDSSLQKELADLLLRLKEQVGYIDRNHDQLLISGRIPTEIGDIRNNIISIKKSLDSKISNWERSKYIVKPALRPNEE
jgi:hypothetical protein